MQCWDVLQIEQSTDIKKIKSAYALLLRSNKPDENPQQFQNLHVAYKQAMAIAKNVLREQQTNVSDQNVDGHSETETREDTVILGGKNQREDDDSEATDIRHDEVFDNTQNTEDKLYEERVNKYIDSTITRMTELLETKQNKHDFSHWQFLEHEPLLLDPNVNFRIGLWLFQRIATLRLEYNKLSSRQKKYHVGGKPFTHEVFIDLNSIFDWRANIYNLHHYLGDELCNSMLPWLEDDRRVASDGAQRVRGGQLTKSKADSINRLERYNKAQQHYANFVGTSNWICGVLGGLTLIFAIISIIELHYFQASAGLIVVTLLVMLYFGLKQKNTIAIVCMSIIALCLVPLFPIGTIWGGRALYDMINAL
jgi:hypothetical protein